MEDTFGQGASTLQMLDKIEALKVIVDVNMHNIPSLYLPMFWCWPTFSLHLHDQQRHVIFWGCAIRECRDLIQDTVKNLLGRLPSAGRKQAFESLCSPQF